MAIKKTRSTADILLSKTESTDHVTDVFLAEEMSTDVTGWDDITSDNSTNYFNSHSSTSNDAPEKTLHRTPSKAQLTLFKKPKSKSKNYNSDPIRRNISTESLFDHSEPLDFEDVRNMSSENLTLLAVAHAARSSPLPPIENDNNEDEIKTIQQAIQSIPPVSPLTQPTVPVSIDQEEKQPSSFGRKTLGLAAASLGMSLAVATYIIAK